MICPLCLIEGCGRPVVGSGRCAAHYWRWRRDAGPGLLGAPEAALLVAAVLELGVGSLKNATYAGRDLPDGRTGTGRAWW